MNAMILQTERLNLPEPLAVKLRGKKVELIENGDSTITIKPVDYPIEAMCGILESDGHEVERFLVRMREDKEFEVRNHD